MSGGHVGQPHPTDPESGFTLLELLVSLILLALILSFVGGALRFGARAWEAAGALDRGASMGAVRTFLEQRLAEAMPVYERDETGRVRIAFSGQPQQLSFVSPSARGKAGAGLYRFSLNLEPAGRDAGTGTALALDQSLYRPEVVSQVVAGPEEGQPLLEDIAGIGLRYYGRKEARSPAAWHSEWTRADALPELVEISVLLREQDARTWLPLVVELRLRPAP
jgi:prepilin-type N-terminal cleavage/methylation domain-containing protein